MSQTSFVVLLALAITVGAHAQLMPASLTTTRPQPRDLNLALTDDSSSGTTSDDAIEMAVVKVERSEKAPSIEWKGVTKDSLRFLTVMHAFRIATEPGTRHAFSNPWFKGWFDAIGNMHGYSDGDPFMVNYIGHPMQGAVSSFIWSNNDPAYQKVYFSQDSMYWKERLRSAAFAYVLSAQFEIGPASEASLGNLQSYYPATGFVDHVVTPIVGMGWSIGEDALDRYVIRSFEGRTDSRVLRVLARSMLNPARSFANLMGGKYPWYRTNRPAPSAYDSASYFMAGLARKPEPPPGVAPFEFHADGLFRTYVGAGAVGACVGGSAGVGLRVAREWQIVTDVSGCKMTDVPYKTGYGSFTDTSGDSLTYVVGPRWTRQQSERWSTHAQFLVGGNKVTQQHLDPEKEHVTYEVMKDKDVWPPPYNQFAHSWDSNAVAIVAGAGVDMKFNNALKLRMALDYAHTWNRDLNDISYRNSLQFKTGLVLQMGTW